MKTEDTKKKSFTVIIQPVFDPKPFDGYNKDLPIQSALGSDRGIKKLEVGYIQSTNWPSAGWRLTPRGIEFAGDTTTFPPGVIPLEALVDISDARVLGRAAGSAGPIQQLSAGSGISISGGAIASTITQYTDELAQDAVGGILLDGNTINFTYNDGTPSITGEVITQMSLTADTSGIKLSGDAATPGNNYFYGTNGAGTKGWYERSSTQEVLLSTTTGIDAKTVATTNLYTVPTGRSAIITRAVIRVTAATSATVEAAGGIGIAAGEDDIFASTTLTGLLVTTKAWEFNAAGLVVVGASTNIIKLGIDTGATATTLTFAVDLFGYLI